MKLEVMLPPYGQKQTIEVDDNATEQDINGIVQQLASQYSSQQPKQANGMGPNVPDEPGLQNVSLTPVTGQDLEKQGQDTAESLGAAGHPYLGAAAGTAIAKAPDIAMAAQGISDAPAIAEGVTALGRGAADLAGKGIAKLSDFAKVLTGPNGEEAAIQAKNYLEQNAPRAAQKVQELMAPQIESAQNAIAKLKDSIVKLPVEQAQKQEMLEGLQKAAGKAIGEAEDNAGFGFKTTPEFEEARKDPKAIQSLAETMSQYAKTGPEGLANDIDPKVLQYNRKLAQEADSELSNLGNASLQAGREAATQALEKLSTEFKLARAKYLDITNSLDSLPTEMLEKKAALKSGIIDAQSNLTNLKSQAKELAQAAKSADAEQLLKVKEQANNIAMQGATHDKYMDYIKTLIYGGAATAGGALVKKAL